MEPPFKPFRLDGFVWCPLQCPQNITSPGKWRWKKGRISEFNCSKDMDQNTTGIAGVDRIVVINLVRRPDRRITMLSVARALGIKIEFLDATDGRMLLELKMRNDSAELASTDLHTSLDVTKQLRTIEERRLGALGCMQSHVRVHILAEQCDERILVLEDDVDVEMDFARWVGDMLLEADDNHLGFDLFFLGNKSPDMRKPPFGWATKHLYYQGRGAICPQSYIINRREGARRVLDTIDAPFMKSFTPVDHLLECCWENIRRLYMRPLLTYQVPKFGSDIPTSGQDHHIKTEDLLTNSTLAFLKKIEKLKKY